MSESISRATGAVYRRAWRLWVYASLVVVGAWVGSRWGITGVAWAVFGALVVNYLLMAQLSLGLADLTWRDFWSAHAPAIRLAMLVAATAVVARTALVAIDAARIWVLVGAGSASVAVLIAALWFLPKVFLGPDGIWMARRLGVDLASFGDIEGKD